METAEFGASEALFAVDSQYDNEIRLQAHFVIASHSQQS